MAKEEEEEEEEEHPWAGGKRFGFYFHKRKSELYGAEQTLKRKSNKPMHGSIEKVGNPHV